MDHESGLKALWGLPSTGSHAKSLRDRQEDPQIGQPGPATPGV